MTQDFCLRLMDVGRKATVTRVEAQGELGRRIRDMGIIPGTTLEVVGRAPLRDPVALRLRGCTITLRMGEADHIFVSLEEPHA